MSKKDAFSFMYGNACGFQSSEGVYGGRRKMRKSKIAVESAKKSARLLHKNSIINHRLILISISSIVLVSCGDESLLEVPKNAKSGELVDQTSCTYEAGDEEYIADCASLIVPENRSRPDSRLIALPVVRVRALSKNPAEPIFNLNGGPGQSNMQFNYLKSLVQNHDFVLVGYRGADGSSLLNCPETTQTLKSADDLLSSTSINNFRMSIANCAERLQSEGVDITGYTPLEQIEDMESAREALGYQRINLISQSAGTRVAMYYAQAHPKSLYRSVMIAVNPPGHFFWKAEDTDEQFELYSEFCSQNQDCSSRTNSLTETMLMIARDMPKSWMFIPIRPGSVRLGSFFGMFHTSTDPLVASMTLDAWLSAAEGDASGLAMLSLISELIFPHTSIWGEMAAIGASADLPLAVEYMNKPPPSNSILGSAGTSFLWGGMSSWPQNLMPEEYLKIQPSDIETLLISGSVDFSTPPQFARDELLPSLSKGQQVVLQGFGHSEDIWNLQPKATDELISKFFDIGIVDDSHYSEQLIDFDVGLGYPELAKILLGFVVLIALILLLFLRWIVRRVRRPRDIAFNRQN